MTLRLVGVRAALLSGAVIFYGLGQADAQVPAPVQPRSDTSATRGDDTGALPQESSNGTAIATPATSGNGAAVAPPTPNTEAAQAPSDAELDTIVVTARRVAENQQRVPLAITSFTPKQLERQDLRDASTLTKQVPGLSVFGGNFAPIVFVRGIRNGSPAYFAEVPVPLSGFDTYFDVTNISVLKGPQGTLFGQASNGGAFIFEPAKPGGTLGGTVTASGGDYGRRSASIAINVPVIKDRVLVRLAAESFNRDGYLRDLSNGLRYGDQDYYIIRPSLLVHVTDELQNYTLYQRSHSRDNGNPFVEVPYDFNFQATTSQLPILAQQAAVNGGSLAAFNALRAQVIANQEQLGPYKMQGSSIGCASARGPVFAPSPITTLNYQPVACPVDRTTHHILVNTTTWDVAGDWSLKNIVGHTWGKTFQAPLDQQQSLLNIANGGSPRNIDSVPDNKVWSEEFQVHGKAGIFGLTAGIFYTRRTGEAAIAPGATIGGFRAPNDQLVVYSLSLAGVEGASTTRTSASSKAIYGQTNVDLSSALEGLTFTVGARYNIDKVAQTSLRLNPTTLAVISQTGGPNSPAGHAKFENLSYNLSLQYQYTPGTMFYTTLARGFSAGGLQNVVGFETYRPAVLTNLEVGTKSTFELFGKQIRLNVEGFNGWYDDAQVQTFVLAANSVTGIVAPTNITQNAATAKIRGVDLDTQMILTRHLSVGGFVSYLDAFYTKWASLNPITLAPLDLSSTPFSRTPKWRFGLQGNYRQEIGSLGTLNFHGNMSYRTKMAATSAPRVPTDPTNPRSGFICTRDRTAANGYPTAIADGKKLYVDCVGPMTNLDVGIDWDHFLGQDNLGASLTVTNVTNNINTDTRSNGDLAAGATALGVAPPRMVFATLRYDF